LFRKAADQGNAEAQCSLGVKYSQGQGVKQDFGEAVRWWHKAADQGHARAQCILGISKIIPRVGIGLVVAIAVGAWWWIGAGPSRKSRLHKNHGLSARMLIT
jgi:TPR repeat protein